MKFLQTATEILFGFFLGILTGRHDATAAFGVSFALSCIVTIWTLEIWKALKKKRHMPPEIAAGHDESLVLCSTEPPGKSQAWEDGWWSYWRGCPCSQNPYVVGMIECQDWDQGWRTADGETVLCRGVWRSLNHNGTKPE